jgi:ABC-type branched-subunit amino acid transport system substrate-binding protein
MARFGYTHLHRASISAFFCLFGGGCNAITELDSYSVAEEAALCESNAVCSDEASAAAGTTVPAVCVKSTGQCVELLSEDCDQVTGDYRSDDAIVIGSLFSTKGAQAATNIQRQQSAMLAVTQINDVGGIPSSTSTPRKLVLVSCDESTDLMRAGDHLVNQLRVPAIVGPNTSQDTLDLSNAISVPGRTVLMSPTAVASSVGSLIDDDFTWLMVPTDVQRAPLMISQINALEASIKASRGVTDVKLGIVFRDDALGTGTRSSLNNLVLNGKPLSDPTNLGNRVQISPYDFSAENQNEIIEEYVKFLPDIIVLAGTAEAISRVMVPLEAAWPSGAPRPQYVLIDSVKVPELITAATGNDDLRLRVRGTGITPASSSAPVYEAFKLDYQIAYPGSSIISGMGPAYDATYAIAFAFASSLDGSIDGDAVKTGLRKLGGGDMSIEIGATRALSAFQRLATGATIEAHGTFSALDWSTDGTTNGGTIEMWCIGLPGGKPAYQSSGLTFDVKTKSETGTYTQCL